MAAGNSRNESSLSNLVGDMVGAIAGYWFDKACYSTIDVIKRTAKVGDMLAFHRDYFFHYALYLGNGKVMNICAEDKNKTEALIREMTIEEVCKDSKVRIQNHEDIALEHFQVRPLPTAQILQNARLFQNQKVPYEFTFKNCEYYSSLWRYGVGFSTQVARPDLRTPSGYFLTSASSSMNTFVNGTLDVIGDSALYSKYKKLRPL